MQKLKEELLKLCNESGLPLEAVVFVTKDLWRDAEATLIEYNKQNQEKEVEE